MNQQIKNIAAGRLNIIIFVFIVWIVITSVICVVVRAGSFQIFTSDLESDLRSEGESYSGSGVSTLPLSVRDTKYSTIVKRHFVEGGEGVALISDYYFVNRSAGGYARVTKNALFSTICYLVESGPRVSGVFVLTDRPSNEEVKKALSYDLNKWGSFPGSEILKHSKFFVLKNSSFSPIQIASDIDPPISISFPMLANAVVYSKGGASESESHKLLRKAFKTSGQVEDYLQMVCKPDIILRLGKFSRSGRNSIILYLARMISGPFQIICYSLGLCCLTIIGCQLLLCRNDQDVLKDEILMSPYLSNLPEQYRIFHIQKIPMLLVGKIPTIGLLGTIVGVSNAVISLSEMVSDSIGIQQESTTLITTNLGIAFDTTLIASMVWIVVDIISRSFTKKISENLGQNVYHAA